MSLIVWVFEIIRFFVFFLLRRISIWILEVGKDHLERILNLPSQEVFIFVKKEKVLRKIWVCFFLLYYTRICGSWRGRKIMRIVRKFVCNCVSIAVGINLNLDFRHTFWEWKIGATIKIQKLLFCLYKFQITCGKSLQLRVCNYLGTHQ
jgi:hypothetical protein